MYFEAPDFCGKIDLAELCSASPIPASSLELFMIDSLRRVRRYRRVVILCALAAATLAAGGSIAEAQVGISADGSFDPLPIARGIETASLPSLSFAPDGSDVLTPNNRRNTPAVKIGLRAGINRSAYSNDRYLDNVPLDVGDVSGETDIYSSAAGFGYSAGVDVEYPLNLALSVLGTLQYDHVAFGSSGAVREPCVSRDGTESTGSSIHDFRATLDYLTLAGSMKLSFTHWYLTAGLSAAHPFATTLDRTRRFGGSDCYYPGSGGKQILEEHGEIPAVQRLHYAFRLGGGLIYHLTDRLTFAPEITLDFGFNAINKSPNSDLGVYGISATARYDLK
jgi:hypothetical protein